MLTLAGLFIDRNLWRARNAPYLDLNGNYTKNTDSKVTQAYKNRTCISWELHISGKYAHCISYRSRFLCASVRG